MKLSLETERILEDLEERINPAVEDDVLKQWDVFLSRRFSGRYFVPERKRVSHPAVSLPRRRHAFLRPRGPLHRKAVHDPRADSDQPFPAAPE